TRVLKAAHMVEPIIALFRYRMTNAGGQKALSIERLYDSQAVRQRREVRAYSLEDKFAGRYSRMMPVFYALRKKAQAFGGDVRIYAKKWYIAFARRNVFAVVQNTMDRLDIGL